MVRRCGIVRPQETGIALVESLAEGPDGYFDLFLGVGQRDGALLGGDREEVDATPDHRLTDSDIQVEIVVLGQIVPVDRRAVHEVDTEGRGQSDV